MSSHVDRFYAAVSVVAGHGNIKQRLIGAFEEHLAIVEGEELPLAIREEFAELKRLVTGVEPLNGEGRIRATIRKMSVVEADACAQKLVDVYTNLVRIRDRADELLPMNIGEHATVPSFLMKTASS